MVAPLKGRCVTMHCDSEVGFTPVVRGKSKLLSLTPGKSIKVLGDMIEVQGYEPRIINSVNKVAPNYGHPVRSKKVGTIRCQGNKTRPNVKGDYHQQKKEERNLKINSRSFGLNELLARKEHTEQLSANNEFRKMIK